MRQFQEREGHPRCPIYHEEKDFPLGEWVARQRSRYKSGALFPERMTDMGVLPDNVKRTFVDLDSGSIREYSMRSVRKKLTDNPQMAKLLDAVAVRQIIEQVYNNIIEDQKKVRAMMNGSRDGFNMGGGRSRMIRR